MSAPAARVLIVSHECRVCGWIIAPDRTLPTPDHTIRDQADRMDAHATFLHPERRRPT